MSFNHVHGKTGDVMDSITGTPKYDPNCCCSISTGLLQTLASILTETTGHILSVGCGSGTLEALLMTSLNHEPDVQILGVEVKGKSVSALPENLIEYVSGTWATSASARNASVWMFIYPREPTLLRKYLSEYGHGEVRKIIWLGPKSDWDGFSKVIGDFGGWCCVELVEDCGLVPYEMLVIVDK